MGFEVDFPSLREAAECLKRADHATRSLGTQTRRPIETAAAGAGRGPLRSTLGSLADTMARRSDKNANVVEELWQALECAEEHYYATDHAAGRDLAAVRFAGHDGLQ